MSIIIACETVYQLKVIIAWGHLWVRKDKHDCLLFVKYQILRKYYLPILIILLHNIKSFNNKKITQFENSQTMQTSQHDGLLVRFRLEEMKYLIFEFLRPRKEAMSGVEFHHLTCNPSRTRWKVEKRVTTK